MRTTAIRALIYGLLTFGGWFAGRQFGTSHPPQSEASSEKVQTADNLAAGSPSTSAIVTEELSPSAFYSAVSELPKDQSEIASSAKFFRLAERLSLADFPDAMERLRSLTGHWLARLLEVWAVRNPGAARGWFDAQPEAERIKLFPEWADAWARVDAAGLRQWLASRADNERRKLDEEYRRSWVGILAEVDPAGALQLAQLYPKLISPHSVLQVWAAKDPAAAAAAALTLPANQKSTAADFIMRQWGAKDPDAALAWIEQLPDPALAESARDGFVSGVAKNDPAMAIDLIRSRFPADKQDEQWRFVAAYASMKDPERIATLAQQQSDPKTRRTLIAEAIRFMTSKDAGVQGGLWPPAETEARTDARRAADLWLAESEISKTALPQVDEVAAALAHQYGVDAMLSFLDRIPPQLNTDTKDIPDWVARVRGWNEIAEAALNMQPGERRTLWLEKAVSGLIKQGELDATEALIDRLPAGTERDGAVRAFAAANFGDDPQASAMLLLDLPNGRAHLETEVSQWLKRDSFDARRWIAKTDVLTQEEKSRLLSPAVNSNGGK